MRCVFLLCVGFLAGDTAEYERPLGAGAIDQATLDAEGYGQKSGFRREDSGVRIQLAPGEPETGWKTPQAIRIGGDFTISGTFVIEKLPKPALEDGVAAGISIATQNLDQPDVTLVRLTEPSGSGVYRAITQARNGPQNQQQVMMQQQAMQPGGKPPKPPRPTFPAKGEEVQFVLRRSGTSVEFQVTDAGSDQPRYLGRVDVGAGDIVGVKLFAANRNGAEGLDIVLRHLSIRATRIAGLGTAVRGVFGQVVYGDPMAIEEGKLVIGGPAPAPATPAAEQPAATPTGPQPDASTVRVEQGIVVKAAVLVPAKAAAPAAPAGNAIAIQAVRADLAAPAQTSISSNPAITVTSSGAAESTRPSASATAQGVPKARIPLDEVESIVYDRAQSVSGRFAGQPNVDLTMPGGDKAENTPGKTPEKADDVLAPPPGTAAPLRVPKVDPKPNGIRDLHFTLSGLRNVEIKQVTVAGQTDAGATSWRLDTANSHDWPLVLQRAGTETWVDLFLEPPPGDAHQKNFTVNVMYADGQNGNTTIQIGEHTDPKLAFDPAAPSHALPARVYLAGDEQLFGKIEALDEQALHLTTPWGDRLDVPLARIAGIYIGLSDHKESPESFVRRMKSRGTEDLLLARSKDGEVVAIGGVAEGTEAERLRFSFQGKTRTLPLKQVEGMVFASRPEPRSPDQLRVRITLSGGIVVSGELTALDASAWKLRTAWGQYLNLPAAEVLSARVLGGQIAYLSDLEPSEVEEAPYFGRRSPWHRDVNLVGDPLKIDGNTYAHGIAVHARCLLTYTLGGQYAWFETTVGFDDAVKGRGRVDCRVLADGKELFANPELAADAPPTRLALPIAGVQRLQLVVDFGPDQDTGDRVIWANPRLFRRPPADPNKNNDSLTPK
jgi:hypothetical protein